MHLKFRTKRDFQNYSGKKNPEFSGKIHLNFMMKRMKKGFKKYSGGANPDCVWKVPVNSYQIMV